MEMKKNLFLREYHYPQLVCDTMRVTQHIHIVILFVLCFIYLRDGWLDSYLLNMLSGTALFVIYVSTKGALDLYATVIFCSASFVFSPVLMSLTESISTDTIYAMTSLMLILHLITHNYDLQAVQGGGVVSFNAGIFATVCLASRLTTLGDGYSLIVLSVLIFGVFPSLRRTPRYPSVPYVDILMTLMIFMPTFAMLWTQSITLAILMLLIFVFITFFCPFLLIFLQPLKNNVYGPWDEAVVSQIG